ncbi:hypothetical protein [Vibrio sp. D431a]|uniref:hypothetical protein n=1 Tax=Vibrio sp. D431a TaxID=2837388 RepID=UPI0025577B52|nr:hypothetical protein [Vibrio sp. D431a]MDK9789949.1 hypothetical protein [Vibrio sp. D431a]
MRIQKRQETKPFDLEEARAWANSGKDRPPNIASRATTERHMSEFKPVIVKPSEEKK